MSSDSSSATAAQQSALASSDGQGKTSNSIWQMLSSNTLYKFGFVIVSIVLFLFLVRIGITIMVYTMDSGRRTALIDGMVDGRSAMVFPQDNANSSIARSINEQEGIEFTWCSWIYVGNGAFTQEGNQHHHIFSKGTNQMNDKGIAAPSNAPGVYLSPNVNELVVIMDTFKTVGDEIRIPNIPMEKWFLLLIRCENRVVDIFINGTITRSIDLMDVPRQNYGNVYVGTNGGFDGKLSNLWYYNYALSTSEIQGLLLRGPNTKLIGNTVTSDAYKQNYLSMRWFFD